jgi:hypothetical protein
MIVRAIEKPSLVPCALVSVEDLVQLVQPQCRRPIRQQSGISEGNASRHLPFPGAQFTVRQCGNPFPWRRTIDAKSACGRSGDRFPMWLCGWRIFLARVRASVGFCAGSGRFSKSAAFRCFRSSGFGAIARASRSGVLNASVVRSELGVAVPQVVCGRLAAVFEACL